MTLRDMTPDELELFEEEIVQSRDELTPRRIPDTPEIGREEDLDRDGLPDGPAEDRVPS
jgi:hypothetical protein